MSPRTLAKWEKYLNPTRQLVIPEPRRVSGDFSKTKPPPNQIPVAQFWSFCEQMLRPLTETDMKWLSETVSLNCRCKNARDLSKRVAHNK